MTNQQSARADAERERDDLLAANRRLDQAWQAKDKRCRELEQELEKLKADAYTHRIHTALTADAPPEKTP